MALGVQPAPAVSPGKFPAQEATEYLWCVQCIRDFLRLVLPWDTGEGQKDE